MDSWPSRNFIQQLLDPSVGLHWELARRTRVSPGWQIEDRCLNEHLVYCLITGEAVGLIAGDETHLGPGEFVWLQPGVRHEFRNRDPAHPIQLYHLRFRPMRRGRVVRDAEQLRRAPGTSPLWPALEALRNEFRIGGRLSSLRLRAQLAAVLIQAGRFSRSASAARLTPAQCHLLETALEDAQGAELSPADLAARLQLNADYFRRLFRNTYGIPPRQWLVRRRLEAGADLLRESTSTVSEIAHLIGYLDVFQFSRRFKKEFGVSPLAFRRGSRPATIQEG